MFILVIPRFFSNLNFQDHLPFSAAFFGVISAFCILRATKVLQLVANEELRCRQTKTWQTTKIDCLSRFSSHSFHLSPTCNMAQGWSSFPLVLLYQTQYNAYIRSTTQSSIYNYTLSNLIDHLVFARFNDQIIVTARVLLQTAIDVFIVISVFTLPTWSWIDCNIVKLLHQVYNYRSYYRSAILLVVRCKRWQSGTSLSSFCKLSRRSDRRERMKIKRGAGKIVSTMSPLGEMKTVNKVSDLPNRRGRFVHASLRVLRVHFQW